MPVRRQKTPLHYSRKKDSVEISGDPKDVQKLVWADLITARIMWLLAVLFLFFALPQLTLLPLLIKYLKEKLFQH
jgi:hypothetical protein